MEKMYFYQKQEKLSTYAFIYELPKLLFFSISLIKTNSTLILLEIIHCIGDAINSLITFSLCKILRKNKRNLETIKQEKIEIIIGIVCDLMIIIGLSSFIYLSLHKLHGNTISHDLNLVIVITVISIFIDIFFLIKQKDLKIKSNNILAKVELSTAIEDIIFDVIELISLIIAETKLAYMTPILCIIIALYAIIESLERIREQYLLFKNIQQYSFI